MSPRTNCISTACWHSIRLSPLSHSSSSLTLPLSFSISELRYSSRVWFLLWISCYLCSRFKHTPLKTKKCDKYFNPRPAAAILGSMWLCNSAARPVAADHSSSMCVFQRGGQLGGQRHRTSRGAAAKRVRGAAAGDRQKQLDTSWVHAPHEVLRGENPAFQSLTQAACRIYGLFWEMLMPLLRCQITVATEVLSFIFRRL